MAADERRSGDLVSIGVHRRLSAASTFLPGRVTQELSPAGRYFTVRAIAFDTAPLGLTTVTGSGAVEADATVTVTFNCVALTKLTWLPEYAVFPTVTFSPVPDWKFVPLIVSVCAAAAWVNGFGASEVMVGAGGAFTCRLTMLDVPPLGLITWTA